MSAGSALVEAVLAELRHEELQPLVVFDAAPVRAASRPMPMARGEPDGSRARSW